MQQECVHPPADELQDLDDVERALKASVRAPLVRSVNGFADTEHYLATSWLGRIHKHVLEVRERTTQQKDRLHYADERQLPAGIENRLGQEVETLLEAKPKQEVRVL